MFSLPLNALANISSVIKNDEFSNKTSAELDMNHRFSLNKNSFDLKNDLFEIKIDKEVSFNKRYDTVEFLEKNFAIGKTEVELDKIKYNGIFGEIIAKNQEEFKQKLKENKKNLKVKQENKAKVIVTENAKEYYSLTGRYLQIWGELGELYAELEYGLKRHKDVNHEGSDGFINGKLVEVKTISPLKQHNQVVVKKKGSFEQLLIVRISKNFEFKAKLISRDKLNGTTGKFLKGKIK